jgi:hypothetical protein
MVVNQGKKADAYASALTHILSIIKRKELPHSRGSYCGAK